METVGTYLLLCFVILHFRATLRTLGKWAYLNVPWKEKKLNSFRQVLKITWCHKNAISMIETLLLRGLSLTTNLSNEQHVGERPNVINWIQAKQVNFFWGLSGPDQEGGKETETISAQQFSLQPLQPSTAMLE